MSTGDERPDSEFVPPEDDPNNASELSDENGLDEAPQDPAADQSSELPETTSDVFSSEPLEVDASAEDVLGIPAEDDSSAPDAIVPATLPLLDATGDMPTDLTAVQRSLELWDEAAAEAGDDPRFTPDPTTKSRKELLLFDRGPTHPPVWIDRATMTPVQYSGDVDSWIPGDPTPPFTVAPPSEPPYEPQGNPGVMRPELVVTMNQPDAHFLAALEKRATRIDRRVEQITDEKIAYERWVQFTEERRFNR